MLRLSEEHPIHTFELFDRSEGQQLSELNKLAEEKADAWLKENNALLSAVVKGKTVTLPNGLDKITYEVYGTFIQ